MLPQVAAARAYDTSNGAGAFDDAEDDEQSVGHANGSPSSKGKTRDNKSSAERKRNSTLSAVTVGSQHTAKNRATVENMPSPDPSIAAYDPRETVRQIGARPHTPPLQKIAAATSSTPRTPKRSSGATGSGGAASGLYLPCPMVNATIGYLLRFRLYPNVPPPMAGAPSSPGKRSGRTVRYELVMDDNRPHLAKYKGQWPAMLAEWLSIDTTTFEVEGVVPRATELEQLGDCDIALVSTTRISGNSSPDKRLSMASYDSRVSNDDGGEERTVVARAKLIFQNAAPRGFVPRHGQAF
jgi:axial budding pattern protein 2